MNLQQTFQLYQNSDQIVSSGITCFPVHSPTLAKLNQDRRQFSIKIQELNLSPEWGKGRELFNFLHANIARNPCRPTVVIDQFFNEGKWRPITEELQTKIPTVDPTIGELFHSMLKTCKDLSGIKNTLFRNPLEKMVGLTEETIFVVRPKTVLEEVRHCLKNTLQFNNWTIKSPSSLRDYPPVGRLVLFSPPWILSYNHQEFLVRCPIASKIEIICCAHDLAGSIAFSLLDEQTKVKLHGRQIATTGSPSDDFEPLSPTQLFYKYSYDEQTRELIENRELIETGETLEAFDYFLGGGWSTFFEPSSLVWTIRAELGENPPRCTGIERVEARDLEQDSLILLTTHGGSEGISMVADQILENSKEKRRLQERWKRALSEAISSRGIDRVVADLIQEGAPRATPTNVRNWADPNRIAMEDLENDLKAVLGYLRMSGNYKKVRSGIKQLRSAHQSAARQLQDQLRESLHGADLTGVFAKGFQSFRNEDGAEKTVYIIEDLGQRRTVPIEWEGRLFIREPA